uniref:Uncharacterized protein n=1 Tax=Anguilla anguilla TaxID=7936 RepID=A0A0E9V952_ANGAN
MIHSLTLILFYISAFFFSSRSPICFSVNYKLEYLSFFVEKKSFAFCEREALLRISILI